MQDRKAFWATSWKSELNQPSIEIDNPYCKAFQLTDVDLAHINNQVFKILYYSMDQDAQKKLVSYQNHQDILDWLSSTKIFFIDVVNQLDHFTELEHIVLSSFANMPFLQNVTAIQYPLDIRVVHATPPPKYLERRDAVDYLHTDAWRGEPPDVVNCVLYCSVSEKSSQLAVYDVPLGGIDAFETYTGTEKESGFLVESLKPIQFKHIPGETIFFDAYTPHCTKRNGSQIRISLNFSFRRHDPYETLDDRWDRLRQPWSKYWYLPTSPTKTFEQRRDKELEKLTEFRKHEALQWRKLAIEKLLIKKLPEELYAS